MTLSSKLKEILILMNSGWQLGVRTGLYARWWLQKGGCGYGGETKEIHANTNISKLTSEQLIESDGYGFPTQTFHLTNKGRKLLEVL